MEDPFINIFVYNARVIFMRIETRSLCFSTVGLIKSCSRLNSGSRRKVWKPLLQLRMPAYCLQPDIDYNVIKLMNISFGLEL